GWYLRNSSISAILRSVIGVVTPFRWLVVLLLEGNAPVTFSVNHRPDSTGCYTLPGTLTGNRQCGTGGIREWAVMRLRGAYAPLSTTCHDDLTFAVQDGLGVVGLQELLIGIREVPLRPVVRHPGLLPPTRLLTPATRCAIRVRVNVCPVTPASLCV